jgi:glycerol-3-phosphate dehydrogenase
LLAAARFNRLSRYVLIKRGAESRMPESVYDLAIIGGGVNGCGVARDASGRSLSVYLCEQNDLASGASSAATKLIHGGLRYLEYGEFGLVREALHERETLWRIAPHLIRPLRFILPHHRGLRPAWLLRAGLFLYDHLGRRQLLAPTRTLDLIRDPAGAPLKRGRFAIGFEYSDCWVDDARLVVLNAVDAQLNGARIETRVKALQAERADGRWRLTVVNQRNGETRPIFARALVNAAGPWAEDVLAHLPPRPSRGRLRLVKGSHIVTRKLFDHERAYVFQNADRRVVFAIPYLGDFTLIGATEIDYEGDPSKAAASDAEIDYLIAAASEYFATGLVRADVAWAFSGVRPLYDDGASRASAATRDYVLELDATGPPLISILGGKITTYRRLAEHVLDKIEPAFPEIRRRRGWTGAAPLPGGAFAVTEVEALEQALRLQYPWLSDGDARRLTRAYGLRAVEILGEAGSRDGLGRDFGAGLSEREVDYLMRVEWAETADDVVWRRSKLGLRLSPDEIAALDRFMAGRLAEGQARMQRTPA